jgi:hypothetical protein
MPVAVVVVVTDPDLHRAHLLYPVQAQVEQVHRVQVLVVAATAVLVDPMEALVPMHPLALPIRAEVVVDQATALRQEQQPRLQVALVATVVLE